jgi:hypothetical protein
LHHQRLEAEELLEQALVLESMQLHLLLQQLPCEPF